MLRELSAFSFPMNWLLPVSYLLLKRDWKIRSLQEATDAV